MIVSTLHFSFVVLIIIRIQKLGVYYYVHPPNSHSVHSFHLSNYQKFQPVDFFKALSLECSCHHLQVIMAGEY